MPPNVLSNIPGGDARARESCGDDEDAQADFLVRIVPVVALYAGHSELSPAVEACVRVTQDI